MDLSGCDLTRASQLVTQHPSRAIVQNFKRAVEEAKEVADRREGMDPLTSHSPVDFLDPSTYPSSGDEDAEARKPNQDLRYIPPAIESAMLPTVVSASETQICMVLSVKLCPPCIGVCTKLFFSGSLLCYAHELHLFTR